MTFTHLMSALPLRKYFSWAVCFLWCWWIIYSEKITTGSESNSKDCSRYSFKNMHCKPGTGFTVSQKLILKPLNERLHSVAAARPQVTSGLWPSVHLLLLLWGVGRKFWDRNPEFSLFAWLDTSRSQLFNVNLCFRWTDQLIYYFSDSTYKDGQVTLLTLSCSMKGLRGTLQICCSSSLTVSPSSYSEALSNMMNYFIPLLTIRCDVIAWDRTKPPCWVLKSDSVTALNSPKKKKKKSALRVPKTAPDRPLYCNLFISILMH